jgi:tRNA U55 pseudouridine synthase TruB
MIIEFNKNIGESMNDVINRFKKEYFLKKEEKVSFAGRLDPLAFGKIILLTDSDKYKQDEFCNFDKIYTFSVLQDFQTDTYDVMGIVNDYKVFNEVTFENIKSIKQSYPPYSSKTINVGGKMTKLWELAKQNILKDKEIPTKDVNIYYVKKTNQREIKGSELYDLICNLINRVNGNFRQTEILEKWHSIIDVDKIYKVSDYETKITSGGYVRSIANNMNGVAFNICREKYITN